MKTNMQAKTVEVSSPQNQFFKNYMLIIIIRAETFHPVSFWLSNIENVNLNYIIYKIIYLFR